MTCEGQTESERIKEQEFTNFKKKTKNKNAKVANKIMTLGRRSVGKQVGVLSTPGSECTLTGRQQ